MTGKILTINNGSGIIVCDSGDRYEFDNGEIKSERAKNGSVVDFITEDGKAKEIYTIAEAGASAIVDDVVNTAGFISDKAANFIESKSGGDSITKLGFIAAAGMVVSFIGMYTMDLFFYIGFGLELYAVYMLSKAVSVNDIFLNRIKSYASLTIALLLIDSAIDSVIMGMYGSKSSIVFAGVKILFVVALFIYSAISAYKALSLLSKVFENNFFIYAAWAFIIGTLSPIYAITGDFDLALRLPYILFSIHSILMLVGYIKLKEIKTNESKNSL